MTSCGQPSLEHVHLAAPPQCGTAPVLPSTGVHACRVARELELTRGGTEISPDGSAHIARAPPRRSRPTLTSRSTPRRPFPGLSCLWRDRLEPAQHPSRGAPIPSGSQESGSTVVGGATSARSRHRGRRQCAQVCIGLLVALRHRSGCALKEVSARQRWERLVGFCLGGTVTKDCQYGVGCGLLFS